MPRYVDLDKLPLVNIDVDTINSTAYVDIREVQQALRQAEAHTGEVAPVVHGHWMSWEEMFPEQTPRKKNNLGVFCSECNSHNDTRRNYCPECGADMRGGNEYGDES